ncbi:MAG: quinone-dependent dihydroorotate dehydrogenase [Paracoccaceae bacterium]
MSVLERLGLPLLRLLDPEKAHGLALTSLSAGLAGGPGPVTSHRLKTNLAGIDLANPVGVAAGFDKNAEAVGATLRTGFGFCEIGAVTPRPQAGNPRPRLFRLSHDRAAINRFGFNNQGMEIVAARHAANRPKGIVGINLGANKDSEDKAADYEAVLTRFHGLVDFATVNVSSPNTERLRDLQGRAALDAVLARVLEARDKLGPLPVFLKIAPDLSADEINDIAEICLARRVDAIVATNTTLARDRLRDPNRTQAGGMSGAPLFHRSTEIVRDLYRATKGEIPLIGAGGIASAEDAYAKIRAGASAVQLYTALVYEGISLGARIARGLDQLLIEDGLARVSDAVGTDA